MTSKGERTRNTKSRIDYLDGIRGVAIVLVLAIHWGRSVGGVFEAGYIGVDVFLVLSGFVITSILWRQTGEQTAWREYLSFLGRRARRLLPALAGFLAVSLFAVLLVRSQYYDLSETAINAAVAAGQGMSIGRSFSETFTGGIYGHTWTLAVEWYFYIVFGLVILVIKRRSTSARALARNTALLAVALYLVAATGPWTWFYFGPVSRASQLLLGASVALYISSRQSVRTPDKQATRNFMQSSIVILCLALLISISIAGGRETGDFYRYVGFPATAAITAVLILVNSVWQISTATKILLSNRPLVWIGRISYSLYLYHLLYAVVLDRTRIPLPTALLACIAIVLTFTLSYASYRYLELPFMSSRSSHLQQPTTASEDQKDRFSESSHTNKSDEK